ncbi:glycoside hydrolase family 51 protein [Wolfiporia cocos MD-104 SS10]|uniref:Glycoside hydrolase family 51 protein n=1 Tax=Wolfiporia cocos (strain MD-104) TaxID=742152 RepID=A0A2H3K929_WOLCO|nr:glycoside hydrolase family 51 protein [Wolfiporia cocos MD-104 SS10]
MSFISLAARLATGLLAELRTPGRRTATTISVNSTGSHTIPTILYGQMFEHSGDGGLYAKCNSCALVPWVARNGTDIAVIEETNPVSSELPNSLQFIVQSDATGSVGFSNEGYRGYSLNRETALPDFLGHPESFTLSYVEIGNELRVQMACILWGLSAWGLSARFPDIKWFANHTFYYDGFERNGTRYMEGEYAAHVSDPNDPGNGSPPYPTVQSSTGEAAFMTGLEGNSDVVFAACYALLLQNVNISGNVGGHTPTLISFEYLFNLNKGDEYLPSTLPAHNGTLYWSISRSSSTGDVYIKLVNTAGSASDVIFDLSSFSSVSDVGSLQLLTGSETTSNSPETPNAAIPVTSSITTGSTFNYNVPGYSISAITLNTRGTVEVACHQERYGEFDASIHATHSSDTCGQARKLSTQYADGA